MQFPTHSFAYYHWLFSFSIFFYAIALPTFPWASEPQVIMSRYTAKENVLKQVV
jgi:hypothetical protein